MKFNSGQIIDQLKSYYELKNVECEKLNTHANYAIEVNSSDGHFALKIYNPASRSTEEVKWEIDLTLHLINNGAPVAAPMSTSTFLQHLV